MNNYHFLSKKYPGIYHFCVYTLFFSILLCGCTQSRVTRELRYPETFAKSYGKWYVEPPQPFIKLHLRAGGAYVLDSWKVLDSLKIISGKGFQYDLNRKLIDSGMYKIPFNDIVLVETNDINKNNPSVMALALMTGITLTIAILCFSSPKSCFGSCPTFYTYDGEKSALMAEGFSSSIAPSLEDSDIDALYFARHKSKFLEVKIKNEAFETHVIRYANILAAPRSIDSRVYQTSSGHFFEATQNLPPVNCKSSDKDITSLINKLEGKEYFSPADSANLASKEELDLTFENQIPGKKGLILGFRQSLMTTFLLYQSFAYMGKTVGDWIAMFERGKMNIESLRNPFYKELGGIEVYVQNDNNQWLKVEDIHETGPIATNIMMVPLPDSIKYNPNKIKLKMTKGYWRLDYASLCSINKEVQPLRIKPSFVLRNDTLDNNTQKSLTDSNSLCINLPGDEMTLFYELPDNYKDYELFSEARGYYLEWMRTEWLKDENPFKVMQMFQNTKQYLKDLAPLYKKVEPVMEKSFWESKYVHQ